MILKDPITFKDLAISQEEAQYYYLEMLRYEKMVERREDKIKDLKAKIKSSDPNDLSRFLCWHCGDELIWGGDHDIEEENDTYSMVSNLSCPKCHCYVEVYYPNEETLKDYKDHE